MLDACWLQAYFGVVMPRNKNKRTEVNGIIEFVLTQQGCSGTRSKKLIEDNGWSKRNIKWLYKENEKWDDKKRR